MITFINRNLEPYRGYHRFMRALPADPKSLPEGHHSDCWGRWSELRGCCTSGAPARNRFFWMKLRAIWTCTEVYYTGPVNYETYLSILQVSACHVYFSYPFVFGWSCLEAMAAGALVVGSATAPVQEVIEHGSNGLLVEFFDQQGLVNCVTSVINNPLHYTKLRQTARATVEENYDLQRICLPKQLKLVRSLRG